MDLGEILYQAAFSKLSGFGLRIVRIINTNYPYQSITFFHKNKKTNIKY